MDELNHIFQEYINQGKYPGIQWQIIHKKTCKTQSNNCIVQKIASKLEDTIRSEIIAKAAVLEAASKKKN